MGFIQKRKYPPNVENTKLTEFAKVFTTSIVIEDQVYTYMKLKNYYWSIQGKTYRNLPSVKF